MQKPRITELEDVQLTGMDADLKMGDPQGIPKLWARFMPHYKSIPNLKNEELYAVQVYRPDFDFSKPDMNNTFRVLAAAPVKHAGPVPEGMLSMNLPGGTYAEFVHKGKASDFNKTAYEIYMQWLPASEYEIDDRPHFQVMGDAYLGPDNPDSEEKVYIPIRPKAG